MSQKPSKPATGAGLIAQVGTTIAHGVISSTVAAAKPSSSKPIPPIKPAPSGLPPPPPPGQAGSSSAAAPAQKPSPSKAPTPLPQASSSQPAPAQKPTQANPPPPTNPASTTKNSTSSSQPAPAQKPTQATQPPPASKPTSTTKPSKVKAVVKTDCVITSIWRVRNVVSGTPSPRTTIISQLAENPVVAMGLHWNLSNTQAVGESLAKGVNPEEIETLVKVWDRQHYADFVGDDDAVVDVKTLTTKAKVPTGVVFGLGYAATPNHCVTGKIESGALRLTDFQADPKGKDVTAAVMGKPLICVFWWDRGSAVKKVQDPMAAHGYQF
ncbi:uncharacterized protein KY384_000832 [Bacidia gigantensis]|uniref:uncharacterized protein n=1 Tax=Bacidia gigantensis TaxID=2732470 RepID=UPI001D038A02|nr:uncharacterized protein KY384_000818 [Bacidia gigantensis]XP_044665353.1 uncharacterized protein KY384_000832 [Bacidia gigantensis]KAG8526056.1 hypothetical protein KY384_000818 [Bacidia gigantensis]KAG8526070.1 hypothetical protein KY384_000832 [Bacidia gigantensis]